MELRNIKWDTALGAALLICSLFTNVMLARRVSNLVSTVDTLRGEHGLKIGQKVSPIHATNLDGEAKELAYSDADVDTVVYVFTPSCHWCKENLPGFHALLDEAKGRYRVVGLSLSRDGLPQYIADQHLTIPVYINPTAKDLQSYNLGGTPETFVVSPAGVVKKIWVGAYMDDQRKDIERSLAITLPSCCS